MSARFDPLLCRALAAELEDAMRGQPLGRLYLDREYRTAILAPRNAPALIMLLHPEAGYLLRRGDWGPLPVSVNLRGQMIETCTAPPDERAIIIQLSGRPGPKRLVLELQTNQWNVVLVDDASLGIEAVLWSRRSGARALRQGATYVEPRSNRRFAAALPTFSEWSAALAGLRTADAGERRTYLLGEIAYTSAINVDHIVGREGAGTGWSRAAYDRYAALRGAAGAPVGSAVLLSRPWGSQPYVDDLGDTDADHASSLLAAFDAAFERWREDPTSPGPHPDVARVVSAPDPDVSALLVALEARRERAERRHAGLRRELERGPRSDELRDIGHLLLSRLSDVPRGARSVALTDFGGIDRTIELDPRREPAENAADYYARAARRQRAEESLPARLAEIEAEVDALGRAIEALPEEGVTEEAWVLAGGRPPAGAAAEGGAAAEPRRLPYRRLTTSGGLELRIGRGSRDNDELTFRHSAPEDVWLHARQAKGAHVILRWGRRDENPPQRDLLEAAIAAAVHSEARHSQTVAVDWTRRKYVRKPRKAPAGAVVPDRVKTLFVEPDSALLRRLGERS